MPTPNEKYNVHLMVRFEVSTSDGEDAERIAVDWLNRILQNAPDKASVKPCLPVITAAQYQSQAHQSVRQLVELLEARGDEVPASLREVLASEAAPSAA